MKKRTGLLLVCALLAALLLSGCSGQKQVEYRADVQSGVSYLQSLETIDPDTVTQKLRQIYAYYAGDAELAEKASIYGALTLYLDFINIFLYVVRLLGMNSRRRN